MIWLIKDDILTKNQIIEHCCLDREELFELENNLAGLNASMYINLFLRTTGINPYYYSLEVIRNALYEDKKDEEILFYPFLSQNLNMSYATPILEYTIENIHDLLNSNSENKLEKFKNFIETNYQDYDYFINNVFELITVKETEKYNLRSFEDIKKLPKDIKDILEVARRNTMILNLAEAIYNKTVLPENIAKEKEKVKTL